MNAHRAPKSSRTSVQFSLLWIFILLTFLKYSGPSGESAPVASNAASSVGVRKTKRNSFIEIIVFSHRAISIESNWSQNKSLCHSGESCNQCDQMLRLKVAQFFPKVAQNVSKAIFIWKGMFFKIAQKSLYTWTTFETKYFTHNF